MIRNVRVSRRILLHGFAFYIDQEMILFPLIDLSQYVVICADAACAFWFLHSVFHLKRYRH